MKTYLRYECEICGTDYGTEEAALKCEALGLPEPMPFLPLDRPVPAFGEDGVRWGSIRSVSVRRAYGRHEWWGHCTNYVLVSRDITDYSVPMLAFDPRYGWDAFRYSDSPGDLETWGKTLAEYGFTEADVDPYFRDYIQQLRRRQQRIEQMVKFVEHVDAADAELKKAVAEAETPPPTFVEHQQGLIPSDSLVRHKEALPVENG